MHKCFRTILTIAYIISIVALCYGIYQCILLPKLVVTIIVVSFIITAISISLFIYAILFSEAVSQSFLMGHIDFCDVILNALKPLNKVVQTVKHTNFKDPSSVHSNTKKPLNKKDPSSVHSNTKKPLNKVVQTALKDNIIKDLYTKKIIHIDELKLCNFDVRQALKEKFILNQFINKKLTINDLRRCHPGTIEALRLNYIQDLFLNGKLTWDNLIDHIHNNNTISALANDNIRNMFIDGHLELDQIRQCNLKVVQTALKDNIIKDLYTKKIIHIDELKLCNFDVRQALKEKFILNQFINKKLTINDLRRCHPGTIEALRLNYIQDLFLNGKLTWDNLIDHIHNNNTISALANDNIRNMFIDGHLELDQITQCDLYVEIILNEAFFRNQLINKDMTWDEIMKTVHVEKIKAVITKFFDDPRSLNIVDETKLMKFLRDIKSNSNENPYLNALHDKLNRYNEYFSTKDLNKILNQEEMKIFIKDKVDTLLHQYNPQVRIRANLSLFHSPKDEVKVHRIRIQPRKPSFQNVHIATRT